MLSSEHPRPDDAGTPVVGVRQEEAPAELAAAVGPEYASWGQRVIAALLDNAILAGVTWLALGTGFGQPSLTPGIGATAENGWTIGPLVLIPIGALVILLVLQALTGWTPGKLVIGIRLVRDGSTGQAGPPGLWTTLRRWVLHLLDSILLIGYLRPVWHEKRQTFADGFAHTIVVRELPDLPRGPRLAAYSAALVVCVLGIGYGCVPMSSVSGAPASGAALCELDSPGPLLTTGRIAPGGSLSIERDRRMWTVRETRTVHPGARITWTSDPSARDVDYRVELDARPGSESGTPVISRSWDIGTGDLDSWSDNAGFTHDRTISVDGDDHDVEVDITDSDYVRTALGTDVWLDVRLTADDELVASCGGKATYDEADHAIP